MAIPTLSKDQEKDANFLTSTATAELFSSNLLRLESRELLEESGLHLHASNDTNPDNIPVVSWAERVRDYIYKVTEAIEGATPHTLEASSVEDFPHVELHSDLSKKDALRVEFQGGLKVTPAGSYAFGGLGMTTREANGYVVPSVDLAVLIPYDEEKGGMIFGKDYLNYRYLDKRNLLALHLAKLLMRKKHRKVIGAVSVSPSRGDARRLEVILTPPSSSSKKKKNAKPKPPKFRVRLLLGTDGPFFSPSRLLPDRRNCRSRGTPTPIYNHLLAEDTGMTTIPKLLSEISSKRNFSEAIVLAKVWSSQRGFLSCDDSFGSVGISVSMLYLLRTKKVSERCDAVRIFTAWLNFWSERDNNTTQRGTRSGEESETMRFSKKDDGGDAFATGGPGKRTSVLILPLKGMSSDATVSCASQTQLYAEQSSASSPSLVEAWGDCGSAMILLDPSLTVNFMARCSPSFLAELKEEATKSLGDVHSSSLSRGNHFSKLFLRCGRFWRRYDYYVRIPLDSFPSSLIFKDTGEGSDSSELFGWKNRSEDMGEYQCLSRGLVQMLTLALGNRITAVRVLSCGNGESLSAVPGLTPPDETITDTDQMHSWSASASSEDKKKSKENNHPKTSPVQTSPDHIVLGIRVDPETASRVIDRGPPAEDTRASSLFKALWGSKASLRRFKDGAIVYAVLWDDAGNPRRTFHGILERIVNHVLQSHFHVKDYHGWEMRDISNLIDGSEENNAVTLHKNIMKAFEELSLFLKQKDVFDLPLSIDGVEPVSEYLRYSSLFPPLPHPLLGGGDDAKLGRDKTKKVSGVVVSKSIQVQLRLEGSGKWPTDVKAMGAAKCAMLLKLAQGIDKIKKTNKNMDVDGPVVVMPTYIDMGYKGYSWRIAVRADQEINMLESLQNPFPEAIQLKKSLIQKHVIGYKHHTTIHSLHAAHPSSGTVCRLTKRWIAAHMLSGMIPEEALELLVWKVYSDPDTFLNAPGSPIVGFLRVLELLATHDWIRKPLIIDPDSVFSPDELSLILTQFYHARGDDNAGGPLMYIISPNDLPDQDQFSPYPTFTDQSPERVVLARACELARRSVQHFMKFFIYNNTAQQNTTDPGSQHPWASIFLENPTSIKSYSCLWRVRPELIWDAGCSSTNADFDTSEHATATPFSRTLRKRHAGPKSLRLRSYKNLDQSEKNGVLHDFRPVETLVATLRRKYGHLALFFVNDLTPDIVAMLWRPGVFEKVPFSALVSEYKRPVRVEWKKDSLVVTNEEDVLREMWIYGKDVFGDVKILEDRAVKGDDEEGGKKRKMEEVHA